MGHKLQWDREAAATLHADLQTFGRKFRLTAELRGFDSVVLRPDGFVHNDTIRQARSELQGLLEYHFPEVHEPEQRWVSLRVDDGYGAGIHIEACEHGYRVTSIEEFPGQDVYPGEIIVEINGRPLRGLSEEAMEDTFGECFADGASLCLIRLSEQ